MRDEAGEVVIRFVERSTETGSLRFEMPFQLPPGAYTAYTGAVDATTGASGSYVGPLQVPGFAADTMQLSSVVAYRGAVPTNIPGGVPGRAFQFGNTKLEPIGAQPLTTADSLGLFFFVYGVSGNEVTARYLIYMDDREIAQTRPSALPPQATGLRLQATRSRWGAFRRVTTRSSCG